MAILAVPTILMNFTTIQSIQFTFNVGSLFSVLIVA